MALNEKIATEFTALEGGLTALNSEALHQLRLQAISAFNALGIPSTRHEEWKYTNIKTKLPETITLLPAAAGSTAAYHKFANVNACKLVFVNGNFSKELSSITEEAGLIVSSLKEAYTAHKSVVEKHYGKLIKYNEEHFAALNTAFATDGAFIQVKRNTKVNQPVFIIHLFTTTESFTQSRNLIVAEEGSEITLVEDFQCSGSASFFNHVSEIVIADNASVNITKLQTETANATGVYTLEAEINRDARFTCNTFTFEGKLIRNNLNARLAGQNAEAHLNGLYYGTGDSLIDNHLLVDHIVPNCQSNQLYKGILDNEASGVFNGKIFVKPDAQKTNAFQSSKGILLSPTASINSKPQLEIFADDVKCSHGAAIGQLNEAAVFYLRARGIPADEAKAMLTFAFANEIIETLQNEDIKAYLSEILRKRLNISL
ncbi:MAG: Fe-S cluster assembly protein SufD [Chitinophagales bacterium]